jgi:penicillin-binding protein 1C
MQAARLLFGMRTSRVAGKLSQMWWASVLEWSLTKRQIFELYLNLAPFGGNIEGLETASRYYFQKSATDLTENEVASLIVVPQNPAQFAPHLQRPKYLTARNRFVDQWRQSDRNICRHCDEMPKISVKPHFPFRAPHFSEYVLSNEPKKMGGEIATSLDDVVQNVVEEQMVAYVRGRRRFGISNAAALVVDHQSMQIKAMVGSANFFDADISGQVNGTTAKRSPGSTLKPFIYALGIDQGLLHSRTLLKDTPMSFAAFTPENSDGDFAGPLTAAEALLRSRNVPAVYVASKLLQPNLYDFLSTLGVSGLVGAEHYGLSLALGGAELTMAELIELYGLLPNRGLFRQLSYEKKRSSHSSKVNVLSEEAAFMVQTMLSNQQRPDQQLLASRSDQEGGIFWKTGTSAGFKDAWAIGGVGQYLIAVWVGNFSGDGNRAFSGRQASVPLFLRIIDGLRGRSSELPPGIFLPSHRSRPANLANVKVCTVSGLLPGKHCRATVTTHFIPGVSPIKRCRIHRSIEIDRYADLQLCPSCRVGRSTIKKVYEYWPSDILHLFKMAGLNRKQPPPHNPNCRLQKDNGQLEILAPKRGLVYLLENVAADDRDQLAFEAVSGGDSVRVSWFVGNEYLGASSQGEKLYWRPRPGKFEVRAVDDQGRYATRKIQVQVAH